MFSDEQKEIKGALPGYRATVLLALRHHVHKPCVLKRPTICHESD